MSLASVVLHISNNYLPKCVPLFINRIATNSLSNSTTARPNAYSLWGPIGTDTVSSYMSWHSVTDKQFFDLHLKPASKDYIKSLPDNSATDEFPYGPVTDLFARGDAINPGRSSVFFMFFAQWFTDGFFRSSFHDDRKTTSNHNIDLAQIYGFNEETACLLRSGVDGQLTSQFIDGDEYPDSLGELDEEGKWQVKEKYLNLPYIKDPEVKAKVIDVVSESKKIHLYATGLERGNSILGNICFSTLFLREHNNICKELIKKYADWDDDRLFHTARMINTVILMKLVIEDYVNHIAGLKLLKFDPTFAEKQKWYRTPWIAAEFNLLYRWHSLIPNFLNLNGESQSLVANYGLLKKVGLEAIFSAATQQKAGRIGLKNSPTFMLPNERLMITKGREWYFRSYNEYRKHFSLKPLTAFSDFTSDKELQAKLKALYKTPDEVELTVGLFAEESKGETLTGKLLTTMVAYDAVTQIYTNPLLANHNFTEQHFTPLGMERIQSTKTFQDLIDRNCKEKVKVSLSSNKLTF